MNNKINIETVQEKIVGLDNELDTFIQAVQEIKELRNMAGIVYDDLKHGKDDVNERKKDLEVLISSTKDQLLSFNEQNKGIIYDLEKKYDDIAAEAKLNISESINREQNSGYQREIEKRIKKIEKDFFMTLTRQKHAIMIISAGLIGSILFSAYIFFVK